MHGIIAVGLALAGPAAAGAEDEPVRKELTRLQGTWTMVALEIDGQVFEYPEGSRPRWLVKGNKVFNPRDGEQWGTLTVDPATTPKVLDLGGPGSERPREAIYRLEG